jgi:sugar lactone lactonase YvrE
VAVDTAGNVYIADAGNNVIREVSSGVITTFAGTKGTIGYSGDNGPAIGATFDYPAGVAADGSGNVYIADIDNNAIRKVAKGVMTTFAGDGTSGYSGDNGPPPGAELNHPGGVAVDGAGNVYIADMTNNVIRKVSKGAIATLAGGGSVIFGDNGPAKDAALFSPFGVAADASGNVYIADTSDNAIRKVSDGVITTFAGSGIYGYSGDNGAAIGAALNQPYDVAADASGNVYIADTLNNVIRKVSNGVITTFAGNGCCYPGETGDNLAATSVALRSPTGVAVDSAGNVYIADLGNNVVRKVSNGAITTIAGNGTRGYSGDGGPATSAAFIMPSAVAVDASGSVYILEQRCPRDPGGLQWLDRHHCRKWHEWILGRRRPSHQRRVVRSRWRGRGPGGQCVYLGKRPHQCDPQGLERHHHDDCRQ